MDQLLSYLGSDEVNIPLLKAYQSVRPLLVGSEKATIYSDRPAPQARAKRMSSKSKINEKVSKKVEHESGSDVAVELLCWREDFDASDVERLVSFLLDSPLRESLKASGIGISGFRWPKFVEFDKFESMWRKRSGKDLQAIIFNDPDRSLYLSISARKEIDNELELRLSPEDWKTFGGFESLRQVFEYFRVDYGHFHYCPTNVISGGHRIVGTREKEPELPGLKHVGSYDRVRKAWEMDNNIYDHKNTRVFDSPMLVFPISILRDVQLEKSVNAKATLRQWIESDTRHGRIQKINSMNYFWIVEPKDMEYSTRQLWLTGFFPASHYFEIAGWDERHCMPLVRQLREYVRTSEMRRPLPPLDQNESANTVKRRRLKNAAQFGKPEVLKMDAKAKVDSDDVWIAHWKLRCSCGGTKWAVLDFVGRADMADQLYWLTCQECQSRIHPLVFASEGSLDEEDGYDEDMIEYVSCGGCKAHNQWSISIRFHYDCDLQEDAEDDFPEYFEEGLANQWQYLSVDGTCRCKHQAELYGIER